MKSKTTAAKTPSAVEQMLEKRDLMVSERDQHLARVAELNGGIESIDTVMSMFDKNHVPLDIRRAQTGAPMLTLTAEPMLTGQAEAGKDKQPQSMRAGAAKTATAEKAVSGKTKPKPASAKSAKSEPDARQSASLSETALADAIADKIKAKTKLAAKSKKKLDAAREEMRPYFDEIDKLKTLEEIVVSHADGVPFRTIREKFLERYPYDVSKPEPKKVFSDRLSSILHSMSQQGIVERSQREGPEGKDSFWISTRGDRRSGQQAETSEERAVA